MHFYIKVYQMTQQKLADEKLTQQFLHCIKLSKMGLFLHLHENYVAYSGVHSKKAYIKCRFALFCHL